MTQYEALNVALTRLEAAMRAGDLWQSQTRPEPAAFDSEQPFNADTMSLGQWLRYVLIPRLRSLMDGEHPLPSDASIAPAAEVYLQENKSSVRLPILEALRDVDNVLVNGELRSQEGQ
ncbi:YqcC family protein [Kushneria sp. Sum13]|uniref:YqcC family protein n=1 Tax=Kushneria sp. Sum13 TaxID=3459196 RepID=UPI004045CE69